MTSHKRTELKKALNNEKTENLLCSVWRHLPEDKRKGEYVIQDQIQYYRDTNVDFLKIMSDGYFEYPLDKKMEDPCNWLEMEPLEENHPYFTEQIFRVRQIVEAVGSQCMTFYNVFAPFSSLRFAASDEQVMAELQRNEKAVLHALDVIAFDNGRLVERVLKEGGCDGIYFCVQGGEKKRFSHEEYRRLITPSDLKVLHQANQYSEWNILHCCGYDGYMNHLENWKDYPSKAVNWSVHVENLDLLEGKEFFGQKAVVGGFRNTREGVLYCGTEQEIEQKAWEMRRRYAKIPGIILGADCSFHSDLESSKIRTLTDVLHK